MLAQLATDLLAIGLLSTWETCLLNLIDQKRPSSVYFFCDSAALCPSSPFYRTMRTPSQTIFGLEPQELPTFADFDMVFLSFDDFVVWNNETIEKYRRDGNNDFTLVVVANMTVEIEPMEEFFAAMWRSGIVKSAVVVVNETDSNLFTFIPFQSSGVCEDTSPVFVGACITAAETVFDLTHKVLNLNQCPIRMTLIDDRPWISRAPLSGRLVSLINEIAFRMNFKFETMSPTSGGKGGVCGPKEFTGARGQVANGVAHMTMGTYDKEPCSTLNYIDLPYVQCMSWCTPPVSERDYIYYFLVRIFRPAVWLALLITIFLVVISLMIMSSATEEKISKSDMLNIILMVYAQVPRHDFRRTYLRTVFTLWIFTCVILRTAYEAESKSQSSVRQGSRILYRLDELIEAGLKLCTSVGSLQSLKRISGPFMDLIHERTTVCKGSQFDSILEAARLKDRAVYTSDLRCSVTISDVHGKKSNRKFWLYPRTGGCSKAIPFVSIVTLKGSPFKQKLQDILYRSFDSGLVNKWAANTKTQRDTGTPQPYTVTQLFPALFVLFIGCFAGSVILLIENTFRIFFHKLSFTQKKINGTA